MAKKSQHLQLTNLELADFFNQMGIILKSGISSLEGLSLLAEDTSDSQDNAMLMQMIETLEISGSLYEAILSTQMFPAYALHMIKIGEESGSLDHVMQALSKHYTREAHFRQMIRSSLLYPCIMLGMMSLVILVLLTKVMPVFQKVFLQLGQQMTGFSALLLNMGESLSRYSIIFIILVVLFILAITVGRKHLPFQKKIQKQIATCRFCEGISLTLRSGLTVENCIDLASELVDDKAFLQTITSCKSMIAEGYNLSEALRSSKVLTGTYARMAYLAEKAGNLDEALSQIASEYEYSVNNKTTRIISLLEPTLVVLLSVIVGTILFSVMIPLLGIMTAL